MGTNSDPRLSDGQALSVPAAMAGDLADGMWRGGPPMEPMPPQGGMGLAAYWHAFRRRWLAATLLGLLIGGLAAPAVYFTYRPQYTALAAFHIAASQESILPGDGDRSATSFEIYKNTQQQYVKSRFVLIAALRPPEVAKLSVFADEPDPVAWLGKNLQVSFPGNAELMHISLRADDPQTAQKLVHAVVEAYTTEIVAKEQSLREGRYNELDKLLAEKETELREKRSQLRELLRQSGSGETEALNMQQQIALQQYAALRTELSATKFRLMRLKWDLASQKAAAERADSTAVTDAEVETALLLDPIAAPLLRQSEEIRWRREEAKAVLVPGREAEYLQRYEETQKANDEALARRREEVRDELKGRKGAGQQADIAQLEQEIAVATEQEKQLLGEAEAAEAQAKSYGNSSIDAEFLREEIALIEEVKRSVADERQRLLIEMRSAPRITLLYDADAPGAPDSDRKLQYTAFAGLAGFFLPFGLILWLDLRTRRVGSAVEISTAGLDVIGAVPRLTGRAAQLAAGGGAPRLRQQLHESVDGIAARLLHLAERDKTRVVLVSSAVGGEGKTTLATQLALSLARTAHRVLLLDFDMRQPSIGQVFDIPLEPGLAGVLRNEAELHEAIQEPEIDHLWVLPAGRADRRLLASLANGAVGTLFTQLREEFDFVVVDGSPLLPVADARFLCRHVDGVVLSVLRDVSSVPSILAACDILAAFGVRPIGAVVTGFPHQHDYYGMGYGSLD